MVINTDNSTNKKETKRLWPKIAISVGVIILIAISGILIFNKPIMETYVKTQSKPATYLKVSAAEMKQNAERAPKDGNFDSDSAVPVSTANLVKAAMANQSNPVVGGISIPALGVNLPILFDSGDYSMLYGAGQLTAEQSMGSGNYVLASHDMWTNESYYSKTLLFSPLKRASVGQDIYLTNKTSVYHYTVYDVRTVLPTAWHDAVDDVLGKNVVTLITCDTDDSRRILVRGELKDVKPFTDDTSKPFNSDFNQYKR